jgi:lysophospholipase L1-like esterase
MAGFRTPITLRAVPHRSLLLVIGVLLTIVASLVSEPQAIAQQTHLVLRPDFEWSMPARFGLDSNADGLIDVPNGSAYAQAASFGACDPCPEPRFTVLFDGSSTEATLDEVVLTPAYHRWELVRDDGSTIGYITRNPRLVARLAAGRYRISLTITVPVPSGSATARAVRDVVVEDLLIVAMGDSYAAGDGNPEIPRHGNTNEVWADGAGATGATADHAAAHRATLAWPAQAALALERADPASSVTFLSVASSGATIDRGLLGGQNGSLPDPQLTRIADLVGDREIDALLISIGGNDVGFGNLIRGLVDADPLLDPICYRTDLANVWASVADGDWNRESRLRWTITNPFSIGCRTVTTSGRQVVAGLGALSSEFDRLATAIRQQLGPVPVYVMEYPDPTGHQRDGANVLCNAIVDDAAPFGFHEISRSEQLAGLERVLRPLNTTIAAAAEAHGWTYVGGVADAFADGHGYCAAWPGSGDRSLDDPDGWFTNRAVAGPTPDPGDEAVSWYRTAAQSAALQGGSRFETTGTLHPNELGQRVMAERLLEILWGD